MTSNGVHIMAPTTNSSQDANGIPELGLTSISQCNSSLELMSAPAGSAQITLSQLLPLFIELEDAEKPLQRYHDKETLFSNTPMSDGECQKAWIDLIAFELAPLRDLPKRCFRPSAAALLKTWTWLTETARSEGISLASTLRTETMLEALWDPDEEWPQELRVAIMHRLASDRATMSVQEHAEAALRDGSTLDRATTVQWVGLLILQAQSELHPSSPRLKKDVFLETWKDKLPEEWREEAKIDALPVRFFMSLLAIPHLTFSQKGSYAVAAEYVRYAAEGAVIEEATSASKTVNSSSAKPVAGNKRKWHEKFAARKQGKPS